MDRKTYYQKGYLKYGVNYKALKWRCQKSAESRYKQIIAECDFEGKNILDVGCGFADIIPFIAKKTTRFQYTGVDITPEFIKVCMKRHPKFRFIGRDYFTSPLKEKFDIVICSGVLNAIFDKNISYRKVAIRTLWNHAKKVLVFNMAGSHPTLPTSEKSKIYYADSLKILDYCLNLTNRVIFRQHYSSKDFTIIMFKKF